MLLDAKKAGYAVPDDRLKEVMADEGRVAQYRARDKIRRGAVEPLRQQSEAYLHYVLAGAGKGRRARSWPDRPHARPRRAASRPRNRTLLEAALFLAGDRRFAGPAASTPRRSPTIGSKLGFYSDAGAAPHAQRVLRPCSATIPAGEPLRPASRRA